MYVDPYWCGVATTLVVELVGFIIMCIWIVGGKSK